MARTFPNWLQAYCKYSSYSEGPPLTHIWTGVSTIAGALRRKVWFDMGFFEWTPNFYIVIVGDAGIITKSTTANIGMDLLRKVKGIHFGPSVVTWQALISSLAKNTESFEHGAKAQLMSAITIVASEMGTFIDPTNREMVDVLVDLWDGKRGAWEKQTKGSGNDYVENPWINMIVCTTPSWLGDNMPESMIGGGFASRVVFVYGDKKVQYLAYPKFAMPTDHKETQDKLVSDLEHIGNLHGEFTIEPEALAWGQDQYEHFWKNPNDAQYAHIADPRFSGYRGRRQTHMHKLAMVLSAAQGDSLVITRDNLIEADQLLGVTEKASLPNIFNNIGKVATSRLIDRLVFLVQRGRITREAVMKDLLRSAEPRIVADVINGALSAGVIRQIQHGQTVFLEFV